MMSLLTEHKQYYQTGHQNLISSFHSAVSLHLQYNLSLFPPPPRRRVLQFYILTT